MSSVNSTLIGFLTVCSSIKHLDTRPAALVIQRCFRNSSLFSEFRRVRLWNLLITKVYPPRWSSYSHIHCRIRENLIHVYYRHYGRVTMRNRSLACIGGIDPRGQSPGDNFCYSFDDGKWIDY